MTTISPQFSARAHFSPRFGEHGAQANPTPQKAPAPHVESVPEEDGFVRVEKDSAHSSAQHTPLSSPPPEKEETASSTGEKPEAEKHELSPKEQKKALKKQNMVPLVTIWTHADNVKDAKTKAEGPQHIVLKKAKWEELGPVKKFALAAIATALMVLSVLTAPLRWLFGDKNKQHAEHTEVKTQAKTNHDPEKTEVTVTAEKVKPAPQHEAKPETVSKDKEAEPKPKASSSKE